MSSSIDRRRFIQLSALALADLSIGGPISCASTPSPISKPHVPIYADTPSKKGRILMCLRPDVPDRSKIRVFNWDDYTFEELTVPVGLIHSVIQDPRNANVLYFFEIFGSCLKYDLATGESVFVDHHGKEAMFSGHGTLTTNGEFLACTEISQKLGSIVALRTEKDLKPAHVLPRECNNSHHVIALPKSPLLAAGVMRGYDGVQEIGAITLYDAEKQKLVHRFDFDFPVLHLMPLSSTEVIGLSCLTRYTRPRETALSSTSETRDNIKTFTNTQTFVPGPIYYVNTNGETKTLWSEKDKAMFADGFGLAKVDSKRFLSGHHSAGKVVLWEDFKMTRIADVPRAKNLIVSRDGTEFMALSEEKVMIYSMETFKPVRDFSEWPQVVCFSGYS